MTDAEPQGPLKAVPLAEFHRKHKAKMVPFAGYEMPVQYAAGIMDEHNHTRAKAGLFDVSHMGQAWLHGAGAAAALERLVPGDIKSLAAGQGRYTMITNDRGGIVDDLIVTAHGSKLFLVVNASRKHIDFPLIADAVGKDGELEIIEDRALLAIQGPEAAHVMARYVPASQHPMFMHGANLHINDIVCHVTRSGYTGEDGFEISVPTNSAMEIAELIYDELEVMPIGLGARDTLRLEAGLCLYGNDLDEDTSPIEADLRWTISKRRREEGGFPGAARIQKELAEGPSRKRVGILPEGRAPARGGTEIQSADGAPIGTVTSGGFGPSVHGPVAMGYVQSAFAEPGTKLNLIVRGKAVPASVVKLPFQPHRYHRI